MILTKAGYEQIAYTVVKGDNVSTIQTSHDLYETLVTIWDDREEETIDKTSWADTLEDAVENHRLAVSFISNFI